MQVSDGGGAEDGQLDRVWRRAPHVPRLPAGARRAEGDARSAFQTSACAGSPGLAQGSALVPSFLPTSWYALAVRVQVLLAVLARGYHFNPVDLNEPFSNYPVGGEPINGLLMDFKKVEQESVSTQ